MPEPVASIVIPVHNRPEELALVLMHLERQRAPDFEVVIVDDGSDTPVADQIREADYRFALRIVREAETGGIARARNAGITTARADIIVFLDSDCELADDDWLEKHVDCHTRLPQVDGLDPAKPVVIHSMVNGIHSTYAGYSDGYSNWFTSCGKKTYMARKHHLPANNTSVRKSVFSLVGLFDEDCRALEDVEWCFRCLEKGVQLLYVPDMPVGHVDRKTFAALWRHYHTIGSYDPVVRSKTPSSPYGALFPRNVLAGWFYAVPLVLLMTVYVTARWLTCERRVLLYVPGILLANVANYAGIMTCLYERRGARRWHNGK